ncbi:HET domain containing protein [Hyaloscypha variabilis]
MSQLSKLTYLPLDHTASSIRLLTLFPSPSSEATIECSLKNASLDTLNEQKPYRALSYVWGDPGVTTPITVNGSQKAVTTNLAAALRHLRALGCVDKPWWIDAICIDQDDVTEKGHQVRLMGDIYRKADEVIAWLGFEGRNDKLEEITSTLGAANPTQKKLTYDGAAIYTILQSNWWTRRWTVQESRSRQ